MASSKIFILIFFFIKIALIYSQCGTDNLKINPKILNIESRLRSNIVSGNISETYTPIKIGYDFTTLDNSNYISSSSLANVKLILQETREEFSKILQIRHKNIDLTDDVHDIIEGCELDTIGQDYPNFLMKNDLIIFPMFKSFEDGVLAAASPCLMSEQHHPYGGVLYINNNIDFSKTNTRLYMKNLLFHEITHILAFHRHFFSNLHLMRTEGSTSYIVSKKVIAKAKEHFNCTTLTQIPLENQGGEGSEGSHWESRYMLGDYMVSPDYPDVAMSDITLALFDDTGFYKVNYYSGGLFKFGKSKGCRFFNRKCIEREKATFDEFCDVEEEPKCSSSRALKSSCYLVYYLGSLPSGYRYFSDTTKGGFRPADYCPVAYEMHSSNAYYSRHCQVGTSELSTDFGETIGKNSFCFMSSLLPNSSKNATTSQIPVCYEVVCDTNNRNIIVKIGSLNVTCPSEGGNVTNILNYRGTIECPKYKEICPSSNDSFICNEMFTCFTELANRSNYSYETSYYDYEGSEADIDYNATDEVINPIRRTDSFNIKINLALFIFYFIFLVD